MKKLIALFALLLLLPSLAVAALSANTVWEVRSTHGNDTYGGGFVVGQGGTDISGSATLVTGSSCTTVTSSAYNFTAADVGKYINVTAGTGWTTGWYQILSAAANAATLDHCPAAASTSGGTYSLYTAIDYSQQNADNTSGSNISTTDAVAAGTTTITSATASFTANIIGNVIYLAGGSGTLTAGWYQVTGYTNATTITVDRTVASGTGITMNIGGALADLNTVAPIEVVSNTIWWKNEAIYTTTSGITFANAVHLYGYTTIRGDGGRPTLQGKTTSGLTLLTFNSLVDLQNAIIDCNNLPGTSSTGIGIYFNTGNIYTNNVTVKNYYYAGIVTIASGNGTDKLNNVEITGSANSSSYAINNGGQCAPELFNSAIHDTAGYGIASGYCGGPFRNNLFYNITNGVINLGSDCGPVIATDNTFYNDGTAITLSSGCTTFFTNQITNNLFVDLSGWAISGGTSGILPSPAYDGNAYYNNASGNIQLYGEGTIGTTTFPYQNTHDVILTANPFVNANSGNFALNNTPGGGAALRGTGQPSAWTGLSTTTNHVSFGAVQPDTAGTGGSYVFGQ